jgi:hypothetical protein
MATITFDIVTDLTRSMDHDAERISATRGLVRLGLGAYFIIRFSRESRRTMDILRTAHAACADSCPECSCVESIYNNVRTVRDKVISTAKDIYALPLPSFMKRQLADSVAEWDDLAEDCAIVSDPDIRTSIAAIASRL